MADQVRVRLAVRGLVQGVGYRYFARRAAEALDLSGYVRNRPDGVVEVVAEGARPAVMAFIDEIGVGPRHAVVERVDLAWEAPTGDLNGFNYVF
jgi:acylphosphatase